MNPNALAYAKTERICVIAVEMLDGAPHAATVHYAQVDDPFTLIFKTDRKYRKVEPLLKKESTRASAVIGTNEGNMKTLQMDGEARLLTDADAKLKAAYLAKFPEKGEKPDGPDAVYFMFRPTWWRFTDWTGPNGKSVITSDD